MKILKSLERSVADQFIAGGDNDLFEILAIFKPLAFNRDDFFAVMLGGKFNILRIFGKRGGGNRIAVLVFGESEILDVRNGHTAR